ncbi:DUF6185 family protein [Streptomyces sp. NPDC088387]|uniref:DUF6185 family protein n=1 Tax=Streptomyces sp. NPDC088387 TaxID=3365859 RepID=UPI0038262D87
MILWLPGASAPVRAADDDPCRSTGLADAEVSTSLRMEHDDTTYTRITAELKIDLPAGWPLAHDLLLSADSRAYIRAMRCLTGADDDDPNWGERRSRKPVITSKGGRVRVDHEAYGWVDEYRGSTVVGLWSVQPRGVHEWQVGLSPPPALLDARWNRIGLDPGRPGVESAQPEPEAREGATGVVWRPGEGKPNAAHSYEDLAVTGIVRPAWWRAWPAWSAHPVAVVMDFVGALLWGSVIGALLLVAVRRYGRRPGTPTGYQLRTLGGLRRWAVGGVVLLGLTLVKGPVGRILEESGVAGIDALQMFLEHGAVVGCALVLLHLARPGPRVKRLAYVFVVVDALMFLAMLSVMGSGTLPFSWGPYTDEDAGVAIQAVDSMCLVALLLLAAVLAAWRLASEGRLLPPSRRRPGHDRRLRLRVAGPAVLAATLFMAVCLALTEERNWQQASWLIDPADSGYGVQHRWDFFWEALWSVSYVSDWLLSTNGWWLTSLAVIAALRAWHNPAALSPLDDPADRVLLLAFFPLTVGLDTQNHLDNSLLEFLWPPLYILALYGITTALAHRSVLAQPFEISRRPLSTVAGPAGRRRLLAKARSYREIHAELRRLDQGLFGDVPPKREDLERRLVRLHEWAVNPARNAAPDRLPARVSVVDAALALGPRDDWWGNGVRGARLALVPGIPAAVLNTWSQGVRGEGWRNTFTELLGFPGLVSTLVSWTVTFAGAGFVLGALWRVLPGRRGAVKALPVAAAFALPVGADVLVARLLRESAANLALHVVTMLFVFTVTAIMLDLDTFGGERRYWQSRFGLLLSVYQMRYYSLQVAYLIGQVIAIITIWQFFAEPDSLPGGGESPPPPNDGGG